MRLRYVLGSGFALAAAVTGAVLGVVFTAADADFSVVLLAAMSTLVSLTTPLIVTLSLAGAIPRSGTPSYLRLRRRLLIAAVVLELIGGIGCAAAGITAPGTAGVLVGVVALGAMATVVAFPLGDLLNFRAPTLPVAPYSSVDRSEVARKVRTVVFVFFAGIAAGLVIMSLIGLAFPADGIDVWFMVPLVVSMGAISASVACMIVAWPYVQRMKDAIGDDADTAKAIRRAVLRGKGAPLDEHQRARAAQWAALMAVYFPFSIAQLSLLYLGLMLQQVNGLVDEGYDAVPGFSAILVGFLALVVVALAPIMIRQLLRIRRYTAAHPPKPVSPTPA